MTARSDFPMAIRRLCADCGGVYYSWGAHAERCPGPRQCRVPSCTNHARHGGLCQPHFEEDKAEACDCPAGFHQRGCPLVYWPEETA